MKSINRFLIVMIATVVTLTSVSAYSMSLQEYRDLVLKSNSQLKSLRHFSKSSDLGKQEADLLTGVKFFSSLESVLDKKESNFSNFEGTERSQRIAKIGFEQQSAWGITHKIYGQESYLNQKNATLTTNPETSISSVVYEFDVSLLKNRFGRSIEAEKQEIVFQSESDKFRNDFTIKQILSQASVIYWRAKTSQETIESLKEVISKGKVYVDWTKKRVSNKLSDESDLRQAEALLAVHEFSLQREMKNLADVRIEYNSLIEVEQRTEIPHLGPFPHTTDLPSLPSIEQALKRDDLKSLEAQLKSQQARSVVKNESTKSDLNFYGSLASTGLTMGDQTDWSKTTSGERPVFVVGVKLSIPLDRNSINSVKDSASLMRLGTESSLERMRYESASNLEQLKSDLENQLKFIEVASVLERSQFKKLEAERIRVRAGRTSTFQIVSFEQEYQNSRQELIKAIGDLWQIAARIELYLETK